VDSRSASAESAPSAVLELPAEPFMVRTAVPDNGTPDSLMSISTFKTNALGGARCRRSARRVLTGGTSTRGHAGSVRSLVRERRLRQGSAKVTASRLVSTGHNM
jgi:hypothetical protein